MIKVKTTKILKRKFINKNKNCITIKLELSDLTKNMTLFISINKGKTS